MFRNLLAVVAVALATATAIEPAMAQRGDHGGRDRGGDHGGRGGGDHGDRSGGDWDRGGRGGGDWDRGGRDHDRGRHGGGWGGGWDRGWDNDWDDDWNWGYSSGWRYGGWGHGYYYRDDDLWLGLGLGSALLGYALTPDTYYGDSYAYGGYADYPTQAPNAWGLRPNQCRWDREFGYWYNRPADVEVQRCADGYGSVYVVQGSHRLLQYR